MNVKLAGQLAEVCDDLSGDVTEIGDVCFHPPGRGASRGRDVVHRGHELRHTQHQCVFESAHVFMRTAEHFLQQDIGFAQPLEQGGGIGAEHRVRFQHLLDA